MSFIQMPATWSHEQCCDLRIQLVPLALRADVADSAPYRIHQVSLPLKIVLPGGRMGVLEIGHEHVRARVQRVDDHLAIYRSGDFYASVEQISGDWRHLPLRLP